VRAVTKTPSSVRPLKRVYVVIVTFIAAAAAAAAAASRARKMLGGFSEEPTARDRCSRPYVRTSRHRPTRRQLTAAARRRMD